ncbi:unnamed protein product [Phyllotreta striolata]|uniref:Uncharacterized protein n=1 Tax=Phyllotreta striolata TaxID=444603 RepID=A0A9N9TI99_PHYSR|nr:unnamed protein product [Phyllotreta striolata]
MLLFRSISLEILIILVVRNSYAQDEYGYDDSGETSEYNEAEEHGHPDYSKYFSVDGPAQSLPLSGFGASEFSGAFSQLPVEFAGTKKTEKILTVPPLNFVPQVQQTQPLPYFTPIQQNTNHHLSAPLRDFFEEAQKSQSQEKEDYIKPGPSYISHALPIVKSFAEVNTVGPDQVERIPPRPNKPNKSNDEDEVAVEDGDKDDEHVESGDSNPNDKYGLELLRNSKPFVDYNIGKSSSTISQYPLAQGLTGAQPKLTPYQKFSFQPIVQASRLLPGKYIDTQNIKPFNPNYIKKNNPILESQPSENVPSHLKDHNCRKVEGGDSKGMNCFVCVNDDTNSKYTQCSYSAEKEPVDYYSSASERYSAPAKEGHFRFRRYVNKKTDPYHTIRERSRKAYDEPSIPEDYSAGFNYEPESYEHSPSEVSFSEQQSEELKKNPQNCKQVDKDGSTCTVCRNPKTGANYEQCSYTSQPQEKKYAYVKEKKYDSDDEPEESKVKPQAAAAPKSDLKVETTQPEPDTKLPTKEFEPTEDYDGQIKQNSRKPRKRDNDNDDDPLHYETYEKNRKKSQQNFLNDKYEIPNYFAESVINESKDDNKKEEEEDEEVKDYEDYHYKLFPEYTKEESKRDEANEDYQIPESTKHNVEEVLAEFTKKDRSKCKKSEKNGMTCFLCVDQNNIQHEECMFIQESRPKSSHVAYHELKGIKKLVDDAPTEESNNKQVISKEPQQQEASEASEVPLLIAAASETLEEKVPFEEAKQTNEKRRRPKKYKKKQSPPEVEPTIKTPTEFDVGGEEGAFSAETKPVYSKVHGEALPKYMVERSEYEQEFDAFSGAY